MKKFAYPVIIDTDIGDDIDDTWTLMLILSSGLFDIKAISLVNYDTEYKLALVTKMLRLAGRENIPVAVSPATTLPQNYRAGQGRWIEGYSLEGYKGVVVRDGYLEFLRDAVLKSDKKVCIFELGPSTLIASLCTRYPEVMKNSFVYAMAGAVRKSYAGLDRVVGEFNIWSDINASRKVFESGWDYTMLPLDVCANLRMTGRIYQEFLKKDTVYANIIKENYRLWTEDEMFNNKNDFNVASSILYDLVVPWYALFPQNFKTEKTPLYIDGDNVTKEGGGGNIIKWASEIYDVDEMTEWSLKML